MLGDKTFAVLKTSPGSDVLGANEEKTEHPLCEAEERGGIYKPQTRFIVR